MKQNKTRKTFLKFIWYCENIIYGGYSILRVKVILVRTKKKYKNNHTSKEYLQPLFGKGVPNTP